MFILLVIFQIIRELCLTTSYKVDGKEFYFKENIAEVTREQHALIHWGYFCDDLEPLFEYVRPSQEIIDLIPRGDNRDVGGAVLNARGEIDKIDMSGENNPMWGVRGENAPNYKHGKLLSYRDNPEIKSVYDKEHYQLNREKKLKNMKD